MEETDTLRQALEKMEHHGYAAVPLLSTEGKYLGTLTDGDVLWGLKKLNFPSLYQMEEIPVMQVNRSRDNKPVHVDVDMEGLLEKVSAQNFVPVIDDEKVFIGIITRRDVIHYLAETVPQSGRIGGVKEKTKHRVAVEWSIYGTAVLLEAVCDG